MDHPLIDLINARIAEAKAKGAFDDLPGAGQPLPPVDDASRAPLGRVLRENGGLPEPVVLSRRIAALRDRIAETVDRAERARLIAEIAVLETRFEAAKRG